MKLKPSNQILGAPPGDRTHHLSLVWLCVTVFMLERFIRTINSNLIAIYLFLGSRYSMTWLFQILEAESGYLEVQLGYISSELLYGFAYDLKGIDCISFCFHQAIPLDTSGISSIFLNFRIKLE